MGCAPGSYLVWNARTNRKIQSGFPSKQAARDYIASHQQRGDVWGVARFTEKGLQHFPLPYYQRELLLAGECAVAGCRLFAKKRGYCERHYRQWRIYWEGRAAA